MTENNEVKVWPQFSLGADPEFVFELNKQHIPAYNLISDDDMECDCCCSDCCDCTRAEDYVGNIGLDGNTNVAEARPHYAYTPIDLVKNIQSMIHETIEKKPYLLGVNWLAGAFKYDEPIGGHIHFGITYSKFRNLKLKQALDYFLSCVLINLEINTEGTKRKEDYGQLGDIREQAWGIEYRSLSCWLHSPAVALGVLSLAKHIVNQAMVDDRFFVGYNWDEVYLSPRGGVEDKYMSGDVAFFKSHFDRVWTVIDSWDKSPDVEYGLTIIKDMVDAGYRHGRGDFKKNWGLSYVLEEANV